MSVMQHHVPERRPSPSMELGTNNPFRARLSGVPLSPVSSADQFSFVDRTQSRNPFLDVFDDENEIDFRNESMRQIKRSNSIDVSSSARPQFQSQLTGSAAELFENLTIRDNPGTLSSSNSGEKQTHPTREDTPPLISISTWDNSKEKSRAPPNRQNPPPSTRNIVSDRTREARRRPRRNSDTSVMDNQDSEQRPRRERDESRRDRDHRSKGERERERGASGRRREGSTDKRRKNAALDVIDKLDVTGIYGSGLFHHDGPFDACNPHRNKSTRRLAPVHAFPADSANNSMSGFGPLNQKADHSHVFGNRDPEAFHDYTTSSVRPSANRVTSFDPKSTIETVHGDESLGLGTSTFLDGAPASRVAMQRTISESMDERPRSSNEAPGSNLQRKKSLFRGKIGDGTRRRAPPPPAEAKSPTTSPTTLTNGHNEDPFVNDYDDAYDQKGEGISTADRRIRERAPSSPRKPHPGITRVNTDEGSGNGLLKRVRSLSKSKRRND